VRVVDASAWLNFLKIPGYRMPGRFLDDRPADFQVPEEVFGSDRRSPIAARRSREPSPPSRPGAATKPVLEGALRTATVSGAMRPEA